MRLEKYEIKAIKDTIYELDKDASIYLFGSRADDNKRGGDIDLLIFSYKLCQKDASEIKYSIWDEIGEQKIDIIIAKDMSDPFVRIVLKEGVKL